VTFARESGIDMSNNEPGKFQRAAARGGRVLNWLAVAILFICVGIAIIN
jgi:hypothetical protein